jgi:hypothetical protein
LEEFTKTAQFYDMQFAFIAKPLPRSKMRAGTSIRWFLATPREM